jgi:hypothetical protein
MSANVVVDNSRGVEAISVAARTRDDCCEVSLPLGSEVGSVARAVREAWSASIENLQWGEAMGIQSGVTVYIWCDAKHVLAWTN